MITIQNEFNYTGAVGTSYLISPFMRPVLLFKVSGDGSLVEPPAVLRFTGVTETVDFDCTYLSKDASWYYYSIDLSDILRFFMRDFDGTIRADDLPITGTAGASLFSNYFIDFGASPSVTLYIKFAEGTADAQSQQLLSQFVYMAKQLPNAAGFNLYDIRFRQSLHNMKWSNDTYNAFFVWLNGATTITNLTNSQTIYSGTPSEGLYQIKLAKSGGSCKLATGLNTIQVVNEGITKTFIIDFDPDCTYINLAWQHPSLGYVSFPFNGARTEGFTWTKGQEFDKFLTTLVGVNAIKEISGYEGKRKITITTKADNQYFDLLQELHGSRHVYLYVGAAGSADASASWVECEVAGASSFRTDRAKGQFSVDLILPEHFNIRF